MRTTISLGALALAFAVSGLRAQAPAPVMVQAAPTANVPVTQPPPAAGPGSQAALQLLNAMKAANAETLKKQEATLQQLDELQKAAEQIKVFTKRG